MHKAGHSCYKRITSLLSIVTTFWNRNSKALSHYYKRRYSWNDHDLSITNHLIIKIGPTAGPACYVYTYSLDKTFRIFFVLLRFRCHFTPRTKVEKFHHLCKMFCTYKLWRLFSKVARLFWEFDSFKFVIICQGIQINTLEFAGNWSKCLKKPKLKWVIPNFTLNSYKGFYMYAIKTYHLMKRQSRKYSTQPLYSIFSGFIGFTFVPITEPISLKSIWSKCLKKF